MNCNGNCVVEQISLCHWDTGKAGRALKLSQDILFKSSCFMKGGKMSFRIKTKNLETTARHALHAFICVLWRIK